jgi:non-canonical (house-cleaning) NTP pyrophosphatase
MVIVLGTVSNIKIDAVTNVFSKYDVAIIPINAESKINSQPVNEETFVGAYNRIADAKNKYLQCNSSRKNNFLVISIENGIFKRIINDQETWQDKAVIITESEDGTKLDITTDTITFPMEYVTIAENRGFDVTTVGKVMAEMNIIDKHDDPHLALTGKSRQQYLEEALEKLSIQLEEKKIINLKNKQLD